MLASLHFYIYDKVSCACLLVLKINSFQSTGTGCKKHIAILPEPGNVIHFNSTIHCLFKSQDLYRMQIVSIASREVKALQFFLSCGFCGILMNLNTSIQILVW